LRIDAPAGGEIDVTAELPPHIAESLSMLGFEPLAGDNMPLEQPKGASAEAKKRRISAVAKERRQNRRGERRSRGPSGKATGRR
jgi:23S rRNA pseudouridine955/2504/2580 synthase